LERRGIIGPARASGIGLPARATAYRLSGAPDIIRAPPGWCEEFRNCKRLELQPFGAQESLALVESLLRARTADTAGSARTHYRWRGGNPFYIEEIIKMFIDQKVILARTGAVARRTGRPGRGSCAIFAEGHIASAR